jgi:hypothetical protein
MITGKIITGKEERRIRVEIKKGPDRNPDHL